MTTTTPTIVIPEGTVLGAGLHPGGDTPCIMQLIARLRGQGEIDTPSCVAHTLRRLLIPVNDAMPNDARQGLIAYAPLLIGTAPESREVALRRAYLCADRAVRVFAPMALQAAGKTAAATALRRLPEIVDLATAEVGRTLTRSAAEAADTYAIYAAKAAAEAAGYAAAEAAGYAAAEAAGYAAAEAAEAAAVAAGYAAEAAGAPVWAEVYRLLDDLIAVTT